jgi:Carboxypeptidase regulatory-like domain
MSLALVLSIVLTPVPSAWADIGPGTVRGTVTDAAGDPLAGIVVSFHRYGEVVQQDATDASGAYEVGPLPPDAFGYYVQFYDPASDFATEWYDNRNPADWIFTPVPVVADTTTTGVDAELEAAATISGRVSTATGAPLAGGKVSMWVARGGGWSNWAVVYTTDTNGRYTIDRLKAADYVVEYYDPATGLQEFWNNASSLYGATPFSLQPGGSVTADAVLGGTITNVRAPSISGPAQVGKPLTASQGEWTPSGGINLAYRWVVGADSNPADDPTGAVYVPSAADIGKTIRVQTTASASGWVSGSALSDPTGPVVPAAGVQNVVRPRIKGVAKVGRTVWVSRGEWEPRRVKRSYQWYVAGKRVPDATSRRFVLKPAHLGKRVKVRLRATAAGHGTATVWTRAVPVRDQGGTHGRRTS